MGIDPTGQWGLIGLSAASSIGSMLNGITGEAGLHTLNTIDAVSNGHDALQAFLSNVAVAGVFAGAGPIIAGGLNISQRAAALVWNKASGLLFEIRALSFLAEFAGETIIKTKFFVGAVDRGIDFASISGTGRNARLIFNEAKNVKGLVRNESFTAFGLGAGKRKVWETNVKKVVEAIDKVPLDDLTKKTIRDQLRRKEITVRVIGSGPKRTEFQSDLLAQLRQATGGWDVAIDFLYTIE